MLPRIGEGFHYDPELTQWAAVPLVGAVPAAGKVVTGIVSIIISLIGCIFSLGRNSKVLKHCAIQVINSFMQTFEGAIEAIPLGGTFSSAYAEQRDKGAKFDIHDLIHRAKLKLDKNDTWDFNPFWLCHAAGKVLLGVILMVAGVFTGIIAALSGKQGLACTKENIPIVAGLSFCITGALQVIPFVLNNPKKEATRRN